MIAHGTYCYTRDESELTLSRETEHNLHIEHDLKLLRVYLLSAATPFHETENLNASPAINYTTERIPLLEGARNQFEIYLEGVYTLKHNIFLSIKKQVSQWLLGCIKNALFLKRLLAASVLSSAPVITVMPVKCYPRRPNVIRKCLSGILLIRAWYVHITWW